MSRRRRHTFRSRSSIPLGLDRERGKLGGVCAGVARTLDLPTLVTRVIALAGLFVIPEATLIGYGLAYLVLDDQRARRHEDYAEY